MANGIRKRGWRAAALAATLALVPLTLGACASVAPSQEDTQAADKESRYAQALRMAASVRAGGDQATAAMFYRRANLLFPNRAEPLVGLAELASEVGAREEAFGYYRQAVSLDPGNTALRRGYGALLLSMGLPDPALEMFAGAVAKDPQDYRAYNGMGIALDLLGRQAEAQDAYGRGLAIASSNASLRNNLALSLAIAGDHAHAITMLEQLNGGKDASPRVRQNLALVYALDQQMQEAVALASRDLSPNELRTNVALYQALPGLSARELAGVVYGIAGMPAKADGAHVAPQPVQPASASLDEVHPALQRGDRAGARPAEPAAAGTGRRVGAHRSVVEEATLRDGASGDEVRAEPSGSSVSAASAGAEQIPSSRRKRPPLTAPENAAVAAGVKGESGTVPLVAVQITDLGGGSSEETEIDDGSSGAPAEGGVVGGTAASSPRRTVKYARATAMVGADLSLLDANETDDAARTRIGEAPPPIQSARSASARDRTKAAAPSGRERGSPATAAGGSAGDARQGRKPVPAPVLPAAATAASGPLPTTAATSPQPETAGPTVPVAPVASAEAPPATAAPGDVTAAAGGAAIGGLGLRLIEPVPSTPRPSATPGGDAGAAQRAHVQPASTPAAAAETGDKARSTMGEGDDALLIPEPRRGAQPTGRPQAEGGGNANPTLSAREPAIHPERAALPSASELGAPAGGS